MLLSLFSIIQILLLEWYHFGLPHAFILYLIPMHPPGKENKKTTMMQQETEAETQGLHGTEFWKQWERVTEKGDPSVPAQSWDACSPS